MDQENFSAALDFARENSDRFVDELASFVSIPSVSTNNETKPHMTRAADWVAKKLQNLDFNNIEVIPTEGAPVVFGDWMNAGDNKPTVLVYGHYDVQPAEPLELWDSPPFEPEIRDNNMYGRGASDMKGQIMIVFSAVEALLRTEGIPVNLKFIIEGEEEIGSTHLEQFIIENKNRLKSDFAFNPDAGMIGEQYPTITYGLRGLSYFEIRLTGPDHDLHSGLFGGTVHNPAQVLCELVAGMHDESGRVTLPGFYDKVREVDKKEREELARLPMNKEFYLSQTGCPDLFGEKDYTPVERVTARPTLEVNGLLSGFTGEGSKTVLPSKAMVKVSTRLVPDQDPYEVRKQMAKYLEERVPNTIRWELLVHSTAYPSITDLNHPAVKALSQAMEQTWGIRPLYRREGGSIPVVAQLQQHLGIESVLTGFSLPDDNLHAPNEKLHLPTFRRGVDSIIRFLSYLV
jgi:acetylornithine deacetylase/succinyl-diaminopimelate desuccinylase-like protein